MLAANAGDRRMNNTLCVLSGPPTGYRLAVLLSGALLRPRRRLFATPRRRPRPPSPSRSSSPRRSPTTVTDYQDFTGRLDASRPWTSAPASPATSPRCRSRKATSSSEGDLLFQIDPRPYQADFNQAEANLKQAEADRNLQEKNVDRARRLVGTGAIGQEEYDQIDGAPGEGRGHGRRRGGRPRPGQALPGLHPRHRPVTGRISRRFVDPGNLVKADNTVLTTIVTEDPMYAYFDVDERTYLDLVGGGHGGDHAAWLSGREVPGADALANEEEFTHAGTVDFVDNRLNGNTGTIRMRGVFDNPQARSRPGLFVRIRLPIGKPYQALLIPDEALQSDQGAKYVYVVNDENEVEYRAGRTSGQAIQGLRVVKEGLTAGERVIVSGMQRVQPQDRGAGDRCRTPPQAARSQHARQAAGDRTRHRRRQ